MIQMSGFELTMLVIAGIGWAGLFHYKGRKESLEFFLGKMVEDKELRDKVFSEFDRDRERASHAR